MVKIIRRHFILLLFFCNFAVLDDYTVDPSEIDCLWNAIKI